jgi:ABC-2 type transport system ATP-binding protein
MEQIIEAHHLSREFKNKGVTKFAVQDLTFSVKKGTIFGLLGPNGAGKSTTIKMMNTLLLPTSGELKVLGHDIYREEKKIRKEIGFLYGGETGLYWQLSGRDNLRYFGSLFKIPKNMLEERIDYWLDRLGLTDAQDQLTMRYSKGMKQRLHIARTLIHDPELLFMDEPTLGLDPEGTKDLREIMLDLKKQGKTIILTTHDMEEAEELCDEIAFIMEGKLIAKGTIESLQEMYEEENRYEIELGVTPSLPVQIKDKGIMIEAPIKLANGYTMIHVTVAKTQRAEKAFGEMIAQLLPFEIKQLVRKKMELRKIYLSMVNGQTKSNQSIG